MEPKFAPYIRLPSLEILGAKVMEAAKLHGMAQWLEIAQPEKAGKLKGPKKRKAL